MLAQFKVGASLRKLKLLDSFNREVLFNCNCIKKSLKKKESSTGDADYSKEKNFRSKGDRTELSIYCLIKFLFTFHTKERSFGQPDPSLKKLRHLLTTCAGN